MNRYKLIVRNNVGDILTCDFYTKMPVWEFCKMYEIQCNCEILKIEKIIPKIASSFLSSSIPKSIAYN